MRAWTLQKKSTRETKLISNHFKIIQRIWPVGVNLDERWKLASTKICKFCNNADDIFHAFAQCKVDNYFLIKLFSHIDPNNIFSHDITIKDFIFGSPSKSSNYIFLVLKSNIGVYESKRI